MVAIGRYSEGTLARMVFGSMLNDVFRQSGGTWPRLIKSLNWPTKVSIKESGTCFKIFATKPHSSADFCTFIRLIALCTSPFSHAISVNCVGSKSPPGSPAKSSSSMSANSFGSGCCETVRCDAACIPGRCFQDVLHAKIVFTFHVFQARSSCLCRSWTKKVNCFRSSTVLAHLRSTRSLCGSRDSLNVPPARPAETNTLSKSLKFLIVLPAIDSVTASWNIEGGPCSSICGFECFMPCCNCFLRLLVRSAKRQWTHRIMKSFQFDCTDIPTSDKIKSICTNIPSPNLLQVQLSAVSAIFWRLATRNPFDGIHCTSHLPRPLRWPTPQDPSKSSSSPSSSEPMDAEKVTTDNGNSAVCPTVVQ